MMMNNTLAQLRDLKLQGMAMAIEEQLCTSASSGLSFEERLALMVDREVHHRGDRKRAALLKKSEAVNFSKLASAMQFEGCFSPSRRQTNRS